jgi:uncharacterized membrane protein YGL010W
MARRLDALWADYEEHHRTDGNKWCHIAGIPLIAAGLMGMLAVEVAQLGGRPVEASLLLLLVAGAAYVWLDVALGSLFVGFTALLYVGMRLVHWRVALALFILGWVLQFVGHGVYEKRSPAFFKNLAHLLVGPLWVLNHVVHLRR